MTKLMTELNDLLGDCGVQSSYQDVNGRRHRAKTEVLLELLRLLGVEIERPEQAAKILEARRRAKCGRGIEPVVVAWDGRAEDIRITLPLGSDRGELVYRVKAASGVLEESVRIEDLAVVKRTDAAVSDFVTRSFALPGRLRTGYLRLDVAAAGRTYESLVISAPRKVFSHGGGREWGCFLPLYALRSQRGWGTGDFTALGDLAQWVGGLGGSVIGTSPLLAAFLDEPFEPSPYRSASRLFWNELYIDLDAIPEVDACAECRELVESSEFRQLVAAQRDAELVDYRGLMALKRRALSRLADYCLEKQRARNHQFEVFVTDHPEVEDYALFRAAGQCQRTVWHNWPQPMRDGRIEEGDYDPADAQYHLYAQWVAAQQLQAARDRAAEAGGGLYLDLPIGVHPDGYDIWRHRSQYLAGATIGAPPDPVFSQGQDWGLPPLHPERIREDGYRFFRRIIANNMKFARYLRIDHVMGLHRLYSIPPGSSPKEGAYICYPADELYAILSVESHRHRCAIVGENLGTVPREVDRRLAKHGLHPMWVAQYELEPERLRELAAPRAGSVASLNTHDMPPIAAWWRGEDIDDRRSLELLSDEEANRLRDERRALTQKLNQWLRAAGLIEAGDDAEIPLAALHANMAGSAAAMVLVNLEDLWLERGAQNTPGTSDQRPNWRRKTRYTFEQFCRRPEVVDILNQLDTLRKSKRKPR